MYKIKNKKAVKYVCKNIKGLSFILSLINGKLVSTHKYYNLVKHNYAKDFNIEILPPPPRICQAKPCLASLPLPTKPCLGLPWPWLKKLSLDNYWLADFSQAEECKYIYYVKFRKVYIMITEGKHLDNEGIKKIISIRN